MSRSTSAYTSGINLIRYAALVVVLATVSVAPEAASAVTYPNFVFSGAGYGHGIGLSQYGAKGYAEHGKRASWIVSHYFPGTTLATPAAKTIKVNLDPGATSSSGYTQKTWRIGAGWSGMGISLNGGAALPDSAGPYEFKVSSTKVAVTDKDGNKVTGSPFSGTVSVTMIGTASPELLQVVGRSGPFKTSSKTPSTDVRYRGSLLVKSNGTNLRLINELPMEDYLYGVVPRESPASWHMEALKAQAIVARSYAHVGSSVLYCDTRSQMYNGYSHGTRSTTSSKMHENARTSYSVDSTKGKCVAYQGRVVATYFSSSSGGYTANKAHVWGGGEIPYLKGVPDPYGTGSFDPWTTNVTLDGRELAAKLAPHVTGEPRGAYVKSVSIAHAWPNGFARTVTVRWSNSPSTTSVITGENWRKWLGLRSAKVFSNAQGSRIGDHARHGRAVTASKLAFPVGAKRVIVVNADGSRYTDALLGAALAGVAQGPVLFVQKNSIPAAVTAEIKRLRPSKLYIVGTTGGVSSSTAAKLKKLVPSTERLQGKDRYAASARVAREAASLGAKRSEVVIVSGSDWRGGAVAAAIAGGAKRPLLFTSSSKLSGAAASVLKEFKTTRSYIVGSTGSVSKTTVASVMKITRERKPRVRLGLTGSRNDLAVAAATYETKWLGFSASTVYAPSSYSMPDVLIGSALASVTKHPFVFASTYTPPAATRAYIQANHSLIKKVTVVGAPTSLGLAVGMRLMSDGY